MNKEFDNILGWTESEHSIRCSKCGCVDTKHMIDEAYYAVENFITDGWRCPKEKVYCPSCAKKYLKSTKYKK